MNVTMELTTAVITAIASTPMVVSCVFATLDGVETALYAKVNSFTDSDTVSTYQVSSVQLVTDKN